MKPQPSKKSRVGLIVGIVLGSISLLLIIAAVLLYFLWWQSPKKMVTDAAVGLIKAKQMIGTGQMTMSAQGFKMTMDIKQSNDAKNSDADITLKIRPKDFSEDLELNLKGIYAEDGAIYVRTEGLEKMVDVSLDAYIEAMAQGTGESATPAQIAEIKGQFKQIADPIVKKLEKQWLKISPSDIAESKEAKCVLDAAKDVQATEKYQKELAEAYRVNDFLIIKDAKVDSKDGARGFEIDLDSREMRDKVKGFAKAAEETEFAKRINDCTGSSTSRPSDDVEDVASKNNATLRLWVNPWSHELKSLELKASDKDSDMDMTFVYDFDLGKSNKVDIPSNARSAKEVMEEIQKAISDVTGRSTGQYISPSPEDEGMTVI